MKKLQSVSIQNRGKNLCLVLLLVGASFTAFTQNRLTNFGTNALQFNTTGDDNSAFGYKALRNNTTGDRNTATGSYAMRYHTTGSENTANGYVSLYYNTSGFQNTVIGSYAMHFNGIGYQNTAIGKNALFSNTEGYLNTATGVDALFSNTEGESNTANGSYSLQSNTTGNYNVANGASAMGSNTTGDFNTGIGYNALSSTQTGECNTALGFYAGSKVVGTPGVYNNYNNSMSLGCFALATASDKVRIGNTNVIEIGGQVGWSNLSDGRFKENVVEDVPGIAFIEQLRPVTYNFNLSKYNKHIGMSIDADVMSEAAIQAWKEQEEKQEKVVYTGFIAQEVEEVAMKTGYSFSGVVAPQSDQDHYSLRYAEFVVPLVKATQEQQKEITAQKNKIEALDLEIAELKKLVADLVDNKTSSVRETGGTMSPVTCYPNPSTGSINLGIENPKGETIEISVFNVAGQLIYSANSHDINFTQEINLTDQADGMYSIHTKMGSASFQNKVLLQK